MKAGDAAAILLNGSSHPFVARTRAAIAHEICHVLHDPDQGGVHVVTRYREQSEHPRQ